MILDMFICYIKVFNILQGMFIDTFNCTRHSSAIESALQYKNINTFFDYFKAHTTYSYVIFIPLLRESAK